MRRSRGVVRERGRITRLRLPPPLQEHHTVWGNWAVRVAWNPGILTVARRSLAHRTVPTLGELPRLDPKQRVLLPRPIRWRADLELIARLSLRSDSLASRAADTPPMTQPTTPPPTEPPPPTSTLLTSSEFEVFTKEPSELVIGLVGPLGTDNGKILGMLEQRLGAFDYKAEPIRISRQIIPALVGPERMPPSDLPKCERFHKRIDLGNQIRTETRNAAALAVAVAAEISRRRPKPHERVTKVAYLVSSLHLTEEVSELRKIYREGFHLFGINTERGLRMKYLAGSDGSEMEESQAIGLIERDEHETEDYGQHTRDAFALADFFCANEGNDDKLRNSIDRCLDLIFGCPTVTPTFNEFAMFMAFGASLRSADLSRQVGAVVARDDAILSTGANDCPRAGGGLYWPAFIGDRIDDAPRGRDYKRGEDSNVIERNRLVKKVIDALGPELAERAKAALADGGPLRNITEYGRVVHAEMEALLACSRAGISSKDATLYCTTFPCHNCAKHIIAAGIKQVVFVEPYPKSKALEFHDDAVTMTKTDGSDPKVRFKPFVGVGPRKFFDLFSMALSSGRPIDRKTDDGQAAVWNPRHATPRVQMLPVSHRTFEAAALTYLRKIKGGENANETATG